jgi:para-nitrobenzyl esterase
MTIARMTHILAAAALAAMPLAGIAQTVPTDAGPISGVPARAGVTAFLGIPFAAPPVGDLRWKPPAPPAPWTSVRKADHLGASCMQHIPDHSPSQPPTPFTAEFDPTGDVSEDCLYLNVWAPPHRPGARLPVMVWIYGGAFVVGSNAVPAYNGEGLAGKGVVVVAMNYRVGIFGFYASKALDAESAHHSSGNYGLLDQIAALRWVRRNAAAFGGDPDKVTIFGQSAGGGSVQILAISPLARGLFQRAISESGTLYPWDPSINSAPMLIKPLDKLEDDGRAYFEKIGTTPSLAALRAMSARQLLDLPAPPFHGAYFSPAIDGWVLPEGYAAAYAHHHQADVPFMVGNNSGEGGAFSLQAMTLAEYTTWADKTFGPFSAEFLRLYPASTDTEALAQRKAAGNDMARVSRLLWARTYGQGLHSKPYVYYFNHVLPGPNAARYGAFHMSEIPYVMGSLDRTNRPITDADRATSDKMMRYWSRFAATGDPGGHDAGLIAWTPVTPNGTTVMEIGDGDHAIPAASAAHIQFFQRFYESHPPM